MMKEDKYDKAIEFLTEHPDKIFDAWMNGFYTSKDLEESSILFQACGPNVKGSNNKTEFYGCLTMVKSGESHGYDKQLTKKIRKDPRVPKEPEEITVEDLPVFAEYQRLMDKIWSREREC